MSDARRTAAAWLALALLPALTGCGAVATVGTTLYSTTEAIATAVKDAVRETDGRPAEGDGGGPGHEGR